MHTYREYTRDYKLLNTMCITGMRWSCYISGQTSFHWQTRLIGGRNNQEGYVQVRTNETSPWFYICDDYWTYLDSDVVCRELGLG